MPQCSPRGLALLLILGLLVVASPGWAFENHSAVTKDSHPTEPVAWQQNHGDVFTFAINDTGEISLAHADASSFNNPAVATSRAIGFTDAAVGFPQRWQITEPIGLSQGIAPAMGNTQHQGQTSNGGAQINPGAASEIYRAHWEVTEPVAWN